MSRSLYQVDHQSRFPPDNVGLLIVHPILRFGTKLNIKVKEELGQDETELRVCKSEYQVSFFPSGNHPS